MSRIVKAITVAAMVGTIAAMVSWALPHGWTALLAAVVVALVVDGVWIAASRMEDARRRAALDTGKPAGVAWGIAALSSAVLAVHALTTGHVVWGAVALLPLLSRVLTWLHSAMEATSLTPAAAREIDRIRQDSRDGDAIARARLRAAAEAERVRLAEVGRATTDLARERAAAMDRHHRAGELTHGSRSLHGLPSGWEVPALAAAQTPAGPVLDPAPGSGPGLADRDAGRDSGSHAGQSAVTPPRHAPVTAPVTPPALVPPAPSETSAGREEGEPEKAAPGEHPAPLTVAEVAFILGEMRLEDDPPLSYRRAAARFRAEGHQASEAMLRRAWRVATGEEQAATE